MATTNYSKYYSATNPTLGSMQVTTTIYDMPISNVKGCCAVMLILHKRDCRQSTHGAGCIYARATEHKTAEYYAGKVPQRCRSSSASQAGSPGNRQPGLKTIVMQDAARRNEKAVLLLLPVKAGCWYAGATDCPPNRP